MIEVNRIIQGDVMEVLKTLPSESIDCCITSPPYWGLRDYGTAKWEGGNPNCNHTGVARRCDKQDNVKSATNRGSSSDHVSRDCIFCGAKKIDKQIGLEKTPEEYTAKMVEVFREVRRVLKKEGTLWLNLGDSYNGSGGAGGDYNKGGLREGQPRYDGRNIPSLKHKDLVGIPWSIAKALQQPYYIGKIKNENDRIWLAAMIDAEGTICGFTHERKDNGEIRNGIHITITNSNTALLDNCFRIWSTTREEHNQHGDGHFGNLPTWRWIVHGIEQKSQLLTELYPYFVGKKKQALLAWNFLEISKDTRGRNKGEEGQSNREKYAWIVDALSKLNHLDSIEIPSWCKEPPSMYEQGWYLRQDIIWQKLNPMPESVTDRCTKSHEYVFLLTKSAKYYYDAEAIREKVGEETRRAITFRNDRYIQNETFNNSSGFKDKIKDIDGESSLNGRNKRSVWSIATQPFPEAHFATFPEDLIEPMIKAGTSEKGICPDCGKAWERIIKKERIKEASPSGNSEIERFSREDTDALGGRMTEPITIGWQTSCSCNKSPVPSIVLDPFVGSGTTCLIARKLLRNYIGIELNPKYVEMAEKRLGKIPVRLDKFGGNNG